MEECIEVHNLTKQFEGRKVVDDLSFTVKKNEVFGLLGSNGAGKSTTIDCILGLHKPSKGYAKVFGLDASEHRKSLFEKVGVQLQHSHYQNNIKVGEVCEEISVLYKNPANYRELLKQFQLDGFINQKVESLSGGERQKLSVLLALIPNPQLIFLDELTTGLDVAARHGVWQNLKELKQQGMSIFLTTHYMEEAENLCDHIMIIKEGKMVVEGSVDEIIKGSPYQSLEDAYLWYTQKEQI